MKFEWRESKYLGWRGNEIRKDSSTEFQNPNHFQRRFGSNRQAAKRIRKRKPPRFIARRLLKNVIDAPSIRLSLGRLPPRRATFRFTGHHGDTERIIIKHMSYARKISGGLGLAPDHTERRLSVKSQRCLKVVDTFGGEQIMPRKSSRSGDMIHRFREAELDVG